MNTSKVTFEVVEFEDEDYVYERHSANGWYTCIDESASYEIPYAQEVDRLEHKYQERLNRVCNHCGADIPQDRYVGTSGLKIDVPASTTGTRYVLVKCNSKQPDICLSCILDHIKYIGGINNDTGIKDK